MIKSGLMSIERMFWFILVLVLVKIRSVNEQLMLVSTLIELYIYVKTWDVATVLSITTRRVQTKQ